MVRPGLRNGAFTDIDRITNANPLSQETLVTDLIYLAGGVVVLLIFVGYAALLRRA
jgi:hypothetical protein